MGSRKKKKAVVLRYQRGNPPTSFNAGQKLLLYGVGVAGAAFESAIAGVLSSVAVAAVPETTVVIPSLSLKYFQSISDAENVTQYDNVTDFVSSSGAIDRYVNGKFSEHISGPVDFYARARSAYAAAQRAASGASAGRSSLT